MAHDDSVAAVPFRLRPLQPADNEAVRELWSTAMRSHNLSELDNFVVERLEDPDDMGDPHKRWAS